MQRQKQYERVSYNWHVTYKTKDLTSEHQPITDESLYHSLSYSVSFN